MKKILTLIVLALAVIVAGVFVFLHRFSTGALPDYNRDIPLEGLRGEVTVIRDSFAIPHIYATNEHDLYMAVGYCMAQDRLWQMDLLRRLTQGRLSEIFGKDLVSADQLFRALRFSEKSERVYATFDPNLRTCLESFADGINQYIRRAGKKLPPEFGILGYRPDPWLPQQSLNLIGYMAWDLSTGWPCEVILDRLNGALSPELARYMVPDLDSVHKTVIYRDFKLDPRVSAELSRLADITKVTDQPGWDIFRGSNNWAVSGTKSETGKPLLANDMHLGLNIPGVWYQMHQVIPGKLNVTGAVLPGQPMVIAGHNDSIAWGFTNVMTDDADFYQETLNPSNAGQYRYDGQWHDFKVVSEVIRIKGGDSVVVSNRFSAHGPVVSEWKKDQGKVLSMRWLGNEDSNEVRSVYLLNRASNWNEFRDALRSFISVNQNAVYADVNGNIGLQSTIGIPLRPGDRALVYPGDTSLYDWKGLVPFDELPFSYNPGCGWVASANCRTAPPDYPYYISSWYLLPYRMDRIVEMLNEKEKLSVADFARMQADQKSKMAEKFTPYFLDHLVLPNEMSPLEKEVYNRLRAWDFVMDKDRPEPLVFRNWYYLTGINLMKDQLDSALLKDITDEKTFFENFMENMIRVPSAAWADDVSTPGKKETFDDIIGLSFRQSVSQLAERFGSRPDAWKWGDAHTLVLAHPLSKVKILDRVFHLNRGPYRVGGSDNTVSPFNGPAVNSEETNHGSSERHIFNAADWNRSLTVIPTGTSGIPASRHYCDQTPLYLGYRYHTDYVTRDKVERQKMYEMHFVKPLSGQR